MFNKYRRSSTCFLEEFLNTLNMKNVNKQYVVIIINIVKSNKCEQNNS